MSTITRGTLFNGPMASYFVGKVSVFLSVGESDRTLPLICKAFRRGAWQPTEICVGSVTLAKVIRAEVLRRDPKSSLTVSLDIPESWLYFGRDSKVVLLDGTWLLPYPIQERPELLVKHSYSLTAESSAHFLATNADPCGSGFVSRHHQRALESAKQRNIPFVLSRCCIEGGNCIMTKNTQGEPVALVGEHSWILSLIALEEQGYFKDKPMPSSGTPTRSAIKIARNFALFQKWLPVHLLDLKISDMEKSGKQVPAKENAELKSKMAALGGGKNYEGDLLRDLTDAECSRYRGAALELQQKLALTLKVMAHELRIPLKNLAKLPQIRFHIDMEMSAFGDKILVHDPRKAVEVLHGFRSLKGITIPTNLGKYTQAAAQEADMFKRHQENIQKKIERVGCNYLPAGVVFEAKGELSFNFINTLHIQAGECPLLFTSDTSKEFAPLQRHFEAVIKNSIDRRLRVVPVDGMKEVVTRFLGGPHCLTWES